MTAKAQPPADQERDAVRELMRIEDAHREAMRCAAMLAEYFDYKATHVQDNDEAMFAAFGFADLARAIMEKLGTIERAAHDMLVTRDMDGAR